MPDPELEPGPRWNDEEELRPFQVVVNNKQQAREPIQSSDEIDDDEMPISLEEIEAAYLRALESAAFMEEIAATPTSDDPIQDGEEDADSSELDSDKADSPEPEAAKANESIHNDWIDISDSQSGPTTSVSDDTPATAFVSEPEAPIEQQSPRHTASKVDFRTDEKTDEHFINIEQVLEALLFVGGNPLPTKKILDILGGSTTSEQLDQLILALNSKYLAEGRPYEIRMQTGGYVMQLREEFESIRSRTYGHGPKEVKLAQDALEVLALIAYKQPISKQEMEETGKQNLGPLLRQLLRRQLIALERQEGKDGEQYKTTPRFLGLFGLQSLEDLPQAGDFNFK